LSTPRRRSGEDPIASLTTTIENRLKGERIAVRAKCVDVDGGILAVVITMSLPSSMHEERRLMAVNVATREYAAFLIDSDSVKLSLDS
jgi:hypothetical protein